MTKLPEIKWTSLLIRNPLRKWWQFWKPRKVVNPEHHKIFTERLIILSDIEWLKKPIEKGDKLIDGIVWKEVSKINDGTS